MNSHNNVESSPPLLTLDHLKKYYPIRKGILNRIVDNVKAVDGVNLSIFPGETLGLVGESGCGKSTIGRSIVGLEKPTEGRILFDGKDIAGLSTGEMISLRSQLQIVFQDPYSSLNPRKRVSELLAEPLKVHRIVPDKDVSKEVDRLLDIVGLPKNSRNRFPHEFSGGQRQRIGIARALSLKPRLIVCDEPVSALDVSIQAQVLNLLKDLQKEFNLTYLFIAHGLGAVRYISDRIAVMYLGKIVEIGTTKEIFENPQHPYTRALLDAFPVTNPRLRNRKKTVLQGDVPSPVNPPMGCRFHTRCPQARAECQEREPELVGDGLHSVACYFPNE
ncbi:ABC transporter ATP-binding protein [Cohnella sp. WQ 127256]|uniref:ABC transporter ATP-binding protein n=1 Tax=Cohnella sp. WQ 127256 TaxID=2938790 RepID=UPI002117324B|nr:ABC transporter ATP-binding protein [Cohnella sp. WQ 127256]